MGHDDLMFVAEGTSKMTDRKADGEESKNILEQNFKLGDTEKLPQETEETKNLNNSQLQRLVLLEQLKLTRIQQSFYNNLSSKFS